MPRFKTLCLCLLVCQVLLHHSPNLPISIEVLPNRALFIERPTDLLRRAADCTLIYEPVSLISVHRFLRTKWQDAVRVNMDPTAPSLENMLVPAPWVFSPAAGYQMS